MPFTILIKMRLKIRSDLFSRTFVDEGGQLDVVVTQALAVGGGPCDLHLVVNIEPFGMMVHLFSLKKWMCFT